MIYEYQAEDGDVITVDRPMTEAPRVGHKIRREGKVYTRILPGLRDRPVIPSYEFATEQLEDFDPRVPYHTKDGRAAFRNKSEVEEFCRRSREEARPGTADRQWFNEGIRHGVKKSKRQA